MIRDLIVNGCSFTEKKSSEDKPWAEFVNDFFNFETCSNLAMGGAGNRYICERTIDYLEHWQTPTDELLVVIMWSGISRKDLQINQDYWNLLELHNYPFKAQTFYPPNEKTYCVFSGGFAGSWAYNPITDELFKPHYKISSPEIMCKDSLGYFNRLSNYLENRKIKYVFTSYLNYWSFPDNVRYGDYVLEHHVGEFPCFKNFNFDNWLFLDNNKTCFGDHAVENNLFDHTNHPTEQAHKEFAEKFMIPKIKEIIL